jgi:hypothetical protein
MAKSKNQPEVAADTIAEGAMRNVHAEAWSQRRRDPARYEDPTISTPGILDDVEGEPGPHAMVSAEDSPAADRPLDPSIDARDQVQPMLDTLYTDALAQNQAAGINPPEATLQATGSEPSQASSEERAVANREATTEQRTDALNAPKSDVNP